MCERGLSDLKDGLRRLVKDFGAYALRVADASEGFENAISGCRQEMLWETAIL
jgi:hypothetical protein